MEEWKERVMMAFPPKEREEALEVLQRWEEEGFCGYAYLRGMADRPRNASCRKRIYEALEAAPPDGFTRWFAREFGESEEKALNEVKASL